MNKEIIPDDDNFTKMLNQTLADLYKDLEEAEKNCKRYADLLTTSNSQTNEMNLALYGPLLNDSLKIKAAVRDKIIKILGNLKDRVRTKEQQKVDNKVGNEFSEKDFAELQEQVLKKEDND